MSTRSKFISKPSPYSFSQTLEGEYYIGPSPTKHASKRRKRPGPKEAWRSQASLTPTSAATGWDPFQSTSLLSNDGDGDGDGFGGDSAFRAPSMDPVELEKRKLTLPYLEKLEYVQLAIASRTKGRRGSNGAEAGGVSAEYALPPDLPRLMTDTLDIASVRSTDLDTLGTSTLRTEGGAGAFTFSPSAFPSPIRTATDEENTAGLLFTPTDALVDFNVPAITGAAGTPTTAAGDAVSPGTLEGVQQSRDTLVPSVLDTKIPKSKIVVRYPRFVSAISTELRLPSPTPRFRHATWLLQLIETLYDQRYVLEYKEAVAKRRKEREERLAKQRADEAEGKVNPDDDDAQPAGGPSSSTRRRPRPSPAAASTKRSLHGKSKRSTAGVSGSRSLKGAEGNNKDEEAKDLVAQDFPSFALEFLRSTYGTPELVNQAAWDLLHNTEVSQLRCELHVTGV